jgi:hypothetical protein
MPDWRRHLLVTRVCVKTTWTLRLGVVLLVLLMAAVTRSVWIPAIARSLVCDSQTAPSDVIVVENFDPNYVVFERAAELEQAGLAPRALVPVQAARDARMTNPIFHGFAEVMARQARLATWEGVPIREIEPISLNAAAQVRQRLAREHVGSILVVTGAFRSRRTSLVYHRVLDEAGIQFRCVPVFGSTRPEHWTATWHGIQEVAEEFLKLQYYRFYVLPFRAQRLLAEGI